MKIRCKICQQVFDPGEFGCDDELLCPVMQLEIIDDDADADEPEKKKTSKKGHQAPSDSPNRT